jgi:predicted MFS family arabinose efflux permease
MDPNEECRRLPHEPSTTAPKHRQRHDRGSHVGEAMVWASRIIAIGIAMFLPGVIGGWADDRFGLRVLGPAGFLLGFAASLYWLSQIAAEPKD